MTQNVSVGPVGSEQGTWGRENSSPHKPLLGDTGQVLAFRRRPSPLRSVVAREVSSKVLQLQDAEPQFSA